MLLIFLRKTIIVRSQLIYANDILLSVIYINLLMTTFVD
jgi:hypothetical protein